jgi:hypothetical protein
MRKTTKRRVVFAGKSLVWASMLFTTVMVLLNWNDVRTSISGKYETISNERDNIIQKVRPSSLDPLESLLDKGHNLIKVIANFIEFK